MQEVQRTNFSKDEKSELRRFQDSVIAAVNPLTRVAILNGRVVGPVSLSTTPTTVNHGLGRQYIGWIVIRNNAGVLIYEDFDWAQQNRSISLTASADTVAYLWVF